MARVRFPVFLALPLLSLLLGSPLLAYTLVLKDGSQMVCKEKYKVEGDKALIVLQNGTQTWIPMAEIDVEKTAKANEVDYGTALVVEDGRTAPLTREQLTARRDVSFSDLVRDGRINLDVERRSAGGSTGLRRTFAGYPDLSGLPRTSFHSPEVTEALHTFLDQEGLPGASIHQGTESQRVFLDMTTDTEGAVFKALETSAKALLEIRLLYPEVEALELLMATAARSRAGQFLLTPERASRLVNGEISPSTFYLSYVEF